MNRTIAAETVLDIAGEDDIIIARQRARELARALAFGMVDQSRIATAVSELCRNVLRYATGGRGQVVIREIRSDGKTAIEVVVTDEGPGIANLDQVFSEGYSTGGGMGMGLPGTRRLMDEMYIDTGPGRGTAVRVVKWCR